MSGTMLCTDLVAYPVSAVGARAVITGLDMPELAYFRYLATHRCPVHFWNGFSTSAITILLQAFLASVVFEQQQQQQD